VTRLYTILALIGTAILALLGARGAKIKAKLEKAKETEKAHERLNNAEIGTDSDDDNIRSLRAFADKHGK